jgi:hypothetical protein
VSEYSTPGGLGIDLAVDDPVGLEFAKMLGDHLLRRPGTEAPKLTEPQSPGLRTN